MIKLDKITEIEIKDGILTISQFDNNEVILTQDNLKKLLAAINDTHCCKSDSEQLNVSFNVGDKVLFDNKKAVVLWTSVKYLDIEIVDTNKILQGVHTSKVLPR